MNTKFALIAVLLCAGLWNAGCGEEPVVKKAEEKKPEDTKPAEAETKKQLGFLLCPDKEHYSSWSLCVTVDKKDPKKVLGICLAELTGLNQRDPGYNKVLAAQDDPKTPRVELATLDAKSFGTGALKVEKNNALNVTVTPDGDNYKLMIDLRIEQEKRFSMGGEKSPNNLLLKYNPAFRAWGVYATSLSDHTGKNLVSGEPVRVTGLVFPLSSTAIVRIYAALAGGKLVLIYDR